MRVGLLTCGDPNTLSGGYLYNRKLLAHLQHQGDQVEVISIPQQSYWRQLSNNFHRYWLTRLIDMKVDLLIQDELVHPSVFRLNRQLSARVEYPIIALVHLLNAYDQHPFYSNWFYRMTERGYLQSVDGMILNSQCTLQQTRELLGQSSLPYTVAVPAGDNFTTLQTASVQVANKASTSEPLKILFVGNLIRRKGLHVLIEALHRLSHYDFQLVVAGRLDMEPTYVKKILKLIDTYHLQERVTIAGAVEGDNLSQLYQGHDLFVLPSAYEGYGIVYVEAQQFSLPVIGTSAGAAPEIIQHGQNGYLIQPGDSVALAEILEQLLLDRQLLLTLGQNARDTYDKHPTWADSCQLIRKFLVERVSERDTSS